MLAPASHLQVASTVDIYNAIRAELLPTPSRSHYTFNLRDLSKAGAAGLKCRLPCRQRHMEGGAGPGWR
jgi:hypothetical protein